MKTIAWIQVLIALIFTTSSPIFAQWVQTNGPYGGSIGCFAVSDMNLFAGTQGSGVFLSTNNGTSWTAVNTGLTSSFVYALAVSGTNLFAGTYDGIFLSTNNGTSWTAVNTGLTNTYVKALSVSGTNLFAGTQGGGVFLSTNNGTSWTEVNTGLTNTNVLSLAPDLLSGNLFAGTYGGVWRRPLSEIITSVEQHASGMPFHFSLEQNYPNPFNPATSISYQLPKSGSVQLTIYNLMGQHIRTLVNAYQPTGTYQVKWDGRDESGTHVSSGIYFYQLKAQNDFIETKKMMMMR